MTPTVITNKIRVTKEILGVELGHVEDWAKQPVSPDMSQHSRQSSEPFGASVTSSEEDEITKKEREIIEVLEKEEQWRYGR